MILITGANGQLGKDVEAVCLKRGLAFLSTDTSTMDITNIEQIATIFDCNPITSVIHCAAYTAVDQAEEDSELCLKINVEGTSNLAKICADKNIKFLYISTDYVFDGNKEGYYEIDDLPSPQSAYGLSKHLGELAVKNNLTKYFIVRISWAFGFHGHNFVRTMLRLSESREQISVVSDQFGSPTYTKDLAPLLVEMILSDKYGTYHATNEGECTWFQFATAIFKEVGRNTLVIPIATSNYPTKAKRPLNSRLSKNSLDKSGFQRLPSWENALHRYIQELKDGGIL
jgi:dTDP-4-dehydrorhamnose reductase